MDSYNSPTTRPLYRTTQAVWYILSVIEVLLVFRFVLKLLGANPNAGFSSFVFDISQVFVSPFSNVFRVTYVEGSVFEWTTLLAMFVYWVVAWGIIHLVLMGKTISTPEAAVRLEQEENK